jgi:hypothetical protein
MPTLPTTRETWTTSQLINHYAHRASIHQNALYQVDPTGPLYAQHCETARATLHTAVLLAAVKGTDLEARVLQQLWDITPDCGALNGEWEDAADALLREHGAVEANQP